MKTKLFRLAVCFLTIVTLGCLTSCKKDNPDIDGEPSIEIRNIETTYTSIKFTVMPANATSYAYACVPYEDYKNNNYTLTTVNNGEMQEYTINDLNYSSPYMLIAIAYNGNLESKKYESRISTDTQTPTLEISEVSITQNTAKVTIKVSAEATSIMYAYYTQEEADYYEENPLDPSQPDWRKWTEFTGKITPEGTEITISDLENNDYLIEAYAATNAIKSEAVKKVFTVKYYTIPYVEVKQHSMAYNDAVLELIKNPLCSQYYAGMSLTDDFLSSNVFKAVKDQKSEILHTENYKGSAVELVKATFTDWAPEAQVTLWILPCDLDGNYTEDPNNIIQIRITIPKRTFVYNGVGTIAISNVEKTIDSYSAIVTPSNCVSYYVMCGPKATFDANFENNDQLMVEHQAGLLAQPAHDGSDTTPLQIKQAALLPGVEYMICAVGIDKDGKIGAVKKEVIKLPDVEFTGAAAITLGTITPTSSDVKIIVKKNEACTSIRYFHISYTSFIQLYNGVFKTIYTNMALGTLGGAQTLTLTKEETELKFTELTDNSRYLLFIIPMDKDGNLGQVTSVEDPTATYFTPKIAFDGTASVTMTYSEAPAKIGKSVTVNTTGNAGCKKYYIRFINKTEAEKLSPAQLAAKILDTATGSIVVSGRGGADAGKKTVIQDVNSTSYFYIMCVDADGKYSDPETYKTLIEINN